MASDKDLIKLVNDNMLEMKRELREDIQNLKEELKEEFKVDISELKEDLKNSNNQNVTKTESNWKTAIVASVALLNNPNIHWTDLWGLIFK